MRTGKVAEAAGLSVMTLDSHEDEFIEHGGDYYAETENSARSSAVNLLL